MLQLRVTQILIAKVNLVDPFEDSDELCDKFDSSVLLPLLHRLH